MSKKRSSTTKILVGSTALAAFILGGANFVFAQGTTSTTPFLTSDDSSGVSACMQAATAKQKTAFNVAEDSYKSQLENLKAGISNASTTTSSTVQRADKEAKKAAKNDYLKAKKVAKSIFETDRKACLNALKAKKKEIRELPKSDKKNVNKKEEKMGKPAGKR